MAGTSVGLWTVLVAAILIESVDLLDMTMHLREPEVSVKAARVVKVFVPALDLLSTSPW
jgi:hypothetical protein